jgi:2-polyprenyl-6-methoxyphenol hydroxylase-like FAD-dependent oxidoreductase
MADADVIVVGAGPTGLMTAAELTLAGVRTVVLDLLPERHPLSRAEVIHPRTAELFDQRGLLEPLLAAGDFRLSEIGHSPVCRSTSGRGRPAIPPTAFRSPRSRDSSRLTWATAASPFSADTRWSAWCPRPTRCG